MPTKSPEANPAAPRAAGARAAGATRDALDRDTRRLGLVLGCTLVRQEGPLARQRRMTLAKTDMDIAGDCIGSLVPQGSSTGFTRRSGASTSSLSRRC